MKTVSVFGVVLAARLLSAIFLHITDCDETYNYWEPLHYLLYGNGLQTWEYSPEYGLRSYLYLILHAAPAWILQRVMDLDSTAVFYCIRCLLAVVCTSLETVMFKSVRRNFGSMIAKQWLLFQVLSPGMFISSTALLPSTFSMYLTIAFVSTWWQKQYKLAILSIVVSSFIGWSFAAFVSLPFLYDMLIQQRLFRKFLYWSFLFAVLVGVPLTIVDSYFYGKLTFAPLNIVVYNIFSQHGPNLFGVESKYFYFINLFLNFNIVWCLAMLCPFLLVLKLVLPKNQTAKHQSSPLQQGVFWKIMPLYVWMLVFFMQPHKEERFIFPVYPLITLCGAITITSILMVMDVLFHRFGKHTLRILRSTFVYGVSATFIIFSLSRLSALYINYHAPLEISSQIDVAPVAKNICLGKEWHRFPGNFFLPSNCRLRFVKSDFNGLLPAYFAETEKGSTIVHSYFNNMNKPNRHMLFEISKCDYLIDFDTGKDLMLSETEPNYSKDNATWEVVQSVPFLNSAISHSFFRAFFVPYIGQKHVKFGSYNLLARKKN